MCSEQALFCDSQNRDNSQCPSTGNGPGNRAALMRPKPSLDRSAGGRSPGCWNQLVRWRKGSEVRRGYAARLHLRQITGSSSAAMVAWNREAGLDPGHEDLWAGCTCGVLAAGIPHGSVHITTLVKKHFKYRPFTYKMIPQESCTDTRWNKDTLSQTKADKCQETTLGRKK